MENAPCSIPETTGPTFQASSRIAVGRCRPAKAERGKLPTPHNSCGIRQLLHHSDPSGFDPNAPLTTGSYRAGRCGLLLSRAESIRRWFQHARSEALRQHRSEDERDRQRGGAGYADLRIGGSTFYSNSRWGVTVSRDLGVHNSIKGYYSSDLTVSSGNEFKTYGLAWQYKWGAGL